MTRLTELLAEARRVYGANDVPRSVAQVNAYFKQKGYGDYVLMKRGTHLWFARGPSFPESKKQTKADPEWWRSDSAGVAAVSHMPLGFWLDSLNGAIEHGDTGE